MNAPESQAPIEAIQRRFRAVEPTLNERTRRLWAAAEANAWGYGGIALVHRATGISIQSIRRGIAQLREEPDRALDPGRQRRHGAGRKRLQDQDSTLLADLLALVNPPASDDLEPPLRWTTDGLHTLKSALAQKGHAISHQSVSTRLRELGYRLDSARKPRADTSHLDRDAQFEYINARTTAMLAAGQPVLTVACSQKESLGPGPEEVLVLDYLQQGNATTTPRGVCDLAGDPSFVAVAMDDDAAAFAVAQIAFWWERVGKGMFPIATDLQVFTDEEGRISRRSRLWKLSLQALADSTGLRVHLSHFPPATTKWSRIAHRLFRFIRRNGPGRFQYLFEVVVSLVGSATTSLDSVTDAVLERGTSLIKIVPSVDALSDLNLVAHEFHGAWNYSIAPRPAPPP
jgi:hypothetical protein